jgi:hypothetical protein
MPRTKKGYAMIVSAAREASKTLSTNRKYDDLLSGHHSDILWYKAHSPLNTRAINSLFGDTDRLMSPLWKKDAKA